LDLTTRGLPGLDLFRIVQALAMGSSKPQEHRAGDGSGGKICYLANGQNSFHINILNLTAGQ